METRQSIAERVRQLSLELAMEMVEDYDENEFGSPFEAVRVRAAEIGDMLMREIAVQRHRLSNLEPPAEYANCPDCQQPFQNSGLRRKKLQTIRGEIEIEEPEYHCHKCRRSFFPDGPMARGWNAIQLRLGLRSSPLEINLLAAVPSRDKVRGWSTDTWDLRPRLAHAVATATQKLAKQVSGSTEQARMAWT